MSNNFSGYVISVVDRHGKFIGYLMDYVYRFGHYICHVSPNIKFCKKYKDASGARCALTRYQNFTAVYKYDDNGEFECEYLPVEDTVVPFGHIHDVKGCRMKVEEIL